MLDDMPGVANEVVQELVPGRGQIEPFPVKTRLVRGKVDLEVWRPKIVNGRRARR